MDSNDWTCFLQPVYDITRQLMDCACVSCLPLSMPTLCSRTAGSSEASAFRSWALWIWVAVDLRKVVNQVRLDEDTRVKYT